MVTRVSRYGRWSVKPSKRDRYPLVTPRYTGRRLTVPMIRTKVFNIVAGVHIVYNTESEPGRRTGLALKAMRTLKKVWTSSVPALRQFWIYDGRH